ncbi:MAG TPA: C25 family cysteine peptidase, partial [Pirellulales bacterium]
MKRLLIVALLLCLSAARGSTAAAESPKWIVATAPEFRSVIAPLVERRRQDGMVVTIINAADLATDAAGMTDPEALRTEIKRLARDGNGLTFVLLVGLASAPADDAKHAEGKHIDGQQIVVPALLGT